MPVRIMQDKQQTTAVCIQKLAVVLDSIQCKNVGNVVVQHSSISVWRGLNHSDNNAEQLPELR